MLLCQPYTQVYSISPGMFVYIFYTEFPTSLLCIPSCLTNLARFQFPQLAPPRFVSNDIHRTWHRQVPATRLGITRIIWNKQKIFCICVYFFCTSNNGSKKIQPSHYQQALFDAVLKTLYEIAYPGFSLWSCTVKLDEDKSEHASLAKEMVLAQHKCKVCSGWIKGTALVGTSKKRV
jgi:hypothetical protein